MNKLLALALVLGMVFGTMATAQAEPINDQKAVGWWTIYMADAVVARPLLMVTAMAGTGIWLVSYPFTAMTGDASTFDVLVAKPSAAAFTRCMGCALQD